MHKTWTSVLSLAIAFAPRIALAQPDPTPPPVSADPTVAKPVEPLPPPPAPPPPPVVVPPHVPVVAPVAEPAAVEVPPTDAATKPVARDGVSAKGLPYAMRGGVDVGVTALRFGTSSSAIPTVIDLGAHIPVANGTFVDARLPFVTATLANPTFGIHHVAAVGDGVWLSIGGAFGLPLVNGRERNYDAFRIARGFWDLQDLATSTVPFVVRAALEVHASIVEIRLQAEPAWGVSTASTGTHFFAFQHAFEAQLGHAIGAGVRYQGVAFGTNPARSGDFYQGATELFFRAVRDPLFARVGVLFPLDTPLSGSANSVQSWGIRAQTGVQFD